MTEGQKSPRMSNLWRIAFVSGLLGVGTGAAFWNQIEAGGGMGWVGWLIVVMLAIITYSIIF